MDGKFGSICQVLGANAHVVNTHPCCQQTSQIHYLQALMTWPVISSIFVRLFLHHTWKRWKNRANAFILVWGETTLHRVTSSIEKQQVFELWMRICNESQNFNTASEWNSLTHRYHNYSHLADGLPWLWVCHHIRFEHDRLEGLEGLVLEQKVNIN